MSGLRIAALVAGLGVALAFVSAAAHARDRFDTVVIDAGHGGENDGARGPRGLLEKQAVLAVARDLAEQLRSLGIEVVLTRDGDSFVALERRTAIANDARGDLFVSIHANAAEDASIRGTETFFLSFEASDDSARRVASRENAAFGITSDVLGESADPLLAILTDMASSDYEQESEDFAKLAQAELARLDPPRSRGVKQAPFAVLTGVQMPAALVEIGFITNASDERDLAARRGRERIVAALARAVTEFGRRYDARRGVADDPSPAGGAP